MNSIREYQPEDASQLEECFIELQEFERKIEPNKLEGKAIAQTYLATMFTRCAETSGKVFVAEVTHRVVGFVSIWAEVRSEEIDEKSSVYAFISDVVVLPAYRGRGLGQALLQRAEDYARQHGATILKLDVLARNTGARKVYEQFGFQEHEVVMTKCLSP